LKFGNALQIAAHVTINASTIGISTCTPLALAIAPTAKGRIQAPEAPKAAAKPMPATWRWAGRSFVAATTAAGKSGPRRKPSRVTATKETGMEGTR